MTSLIINNTTTDNINIVLFDSPILTSLIINTTITYINIFLFISRYKMSSVQQVRVARRHRVSPRDVSHETSPLLQWWVTSCDCYYIYVYFAAFVFEHVDRGFDSKNLGTIFIFSVGQSKLNFATLHAMS